MSLVYLIPQFAVSLTIFVDLMLSFFLKFWDWLVICSLSGVTCEHLLAQSFYKFGSLPGKGGKMAQLEVLMRVNLPSLRPSFVPESL